MDFPTTRAVLDDAESFVQEPGSALSIPERVPVAGSFRWEHATKDAATAQVMKAVRALSGLRAALVLADSGFTVECATQLRTVADFSAEIVYLGEALIEGRLTKDQSKFVEQHFAPFPTDPDELAAREREYYVGRKDIAKAIARLMDKWGPPSQDMDKITAYLNKGYDSFVHGSYGSAMELFTGRTNSFMLHGHQSARFVCVAKVSVAGKLKEFLNALRVMAMSRRLEPLHDRIRSAYDKLAASREDSSRPCAGLS